KGDRPEIPEYTPPFWRHMIESCWHPDPTQRPTCQELNRETKKWKSYVRGDENRINTPEKQEFMENLQLSEKNRPLHCRNSKQIEPNRFFTRASSDCNKN